MIRFRGFSTAILCLVLAIPHSLTAAVITPDWTGEASTPDAEFGTEAAVGDYNGDGFSDVLIGAYTHTNVEHQEGAAYLFYGSATGFADTPGWVWESNLPDQHAGRAVANTGDLNGDLIDDILIGAPTFSNDPSHGTDAAVFLFYGAEAGPPQIPAWTHFSHQHGDRLGRSVDTAGDVNGDGYSDMIFGSYLWEDQQDNEGGVWVIYGSPTGIPLADECDKCHGGGAMWRAESDQAQARMGWGASTAGDVNGDGYDDIVVGVPEYEYPGGPGQAGSLFIYHGSASGLPTAPDTIVDSWDSGSQLGRTVRTAGDVNGDGYSDIIAGARRFDRNANKYKEGAAMVFHGSANGILPEPAWLMVGDHRQGLFGHAVSSAGDVNDDGYADVLVGEQLAVNVDTTITQAVETTLRTGRVNVYLGSPTGLASTPAWQLDGDQAGADFGVWVEPAGDIDADQLDDILVGAWRHDNDQINEGRVSLYNGATLTALGYPPLVNAAPQDYDGDGLSDFLWAYKTGGHLAMSLSTGSGVSEPELLRLQHDAWRIRGTGDYNGDGKADVLQKNTVSGEVSLSLMDGNIVVSTNPIGLGDPTLQIIASGDFDNDARDDILWYSAANGEFYISLMNGAQVLGVDRLSGMLDIDGTLDVLGTGDFNGDGFDDILVHNQINDDVFAVMLQTFSILESGLVYNRLGQADKVVGIDDYNNDQRDDLLVWNATTGDVRVRLMNGVLDNTEVDITQVPDTVWRPVGLGDVNQDQMPDIVWRNQATTQTLVWTMNGTALLQSVDIQTDIGPEWQLARWQE